ncbi:MAG: SPOR domain-containing protein [Emcibacteraceae bacterium]|nr:SPOR domain-containing protein [Emcibacteraceae bacterium]
MPKQNSDNASWLRPLPEEFSRKGMSSKRRMILSAVTLVVLASFSVLIWLSYTSETTEIGPIPVVRADGSVVKVKPVEPGGKEIRFQDREVFNRVDNLPKEEDNIVSSSSEIPLKRPVAKEQVAKITEEAAIVAEKITPAAAPVPIKVPVKTSGNYMIQIAAIDTKSKAEAIWTSVKQKNSKTLSKVTPVYMKVDLGSKGIMYRVRGGMFETRKRADDVCAALKRNKQDCLVVTK